MSAYLKRGVILFTNCSTLSDGGRYTMTSNIFLHLSGFSSQTRTSSLGSKSVRHRLGIFFLINTATPPPVTSPRTSCLSRLKTVYEEEGSSSLSFTLLFSQVSVIATISLLLRLIMSCSWCNLFFARDTVLTLRAFEYITDRLCVLLSFKWFAGLFWGSLSSTAASMCVSSLPAL